MSINGLHSDNEVIAGIGITASIISAGIYAFAEAWVDSTAVGNKSDDESED